MATAISVHGLDYRYGSAFALQDLDFDVKEGCFFGLLGNNGAGKSTALRIIAGLLRSQEGRVNVNGHDIASDADAAHALLGYLPEDNPKARPDWAVSRYLAFFATLYGLPSKAAQPRIREVLQEFQAPSSGRLGELSYGERRRVELCRCFLAKPSVALLDEPTKGLDIPGKVRMWRALSELRERGAHTVVLCSHDTQEIEVLCTEVAVLRQGCLVFRGGLSDLAGLVVEVRVNSQELAISALEGWSSTAERVGLDRVRLTLRAAGDMPILLSIFRERGIEIEDLRTSSALGERLSSLMTAPSVSVSVDAARPARGRRAQQ